MTSASIFDLLATRPVLFDGAMGTELMKRGLPQGVCPEEWNVDRPNVLKDIHRSYYEAGSDSVSTNSFGANRIKLASHGLEDRFYELNRAAAELAGEVRPAGRFVAGDIGPTGKFLKPQGEYEEAEFEAAFADQAEALGSGPVDFFLVETMFDLREALCAVRGIRRGSDLPVFVSMTFNRNPRGFFTLMGDSIGRCVEAFEAIGVPVIGTNCTLTSSDLADCIREMRALTSKPLIAQPNAGKPEVSSGDVVVYSQPAEDFARDVPKLVASGARIVGGCCGTDPEFIRQAAAALKTA